MNAPFSRLTKGLLGSKTAAPTHDEVFDDHAIRVQSLVKDAGERALLFDLDQTIQRLSADLGANREEVLRLTGHYHNLVRKWGAP